MKPLEIIRSMSEDDALLSLQAARAIRAGDTEMANALLDAMSTDGLESLAMLPAPQAKKEAA